MRKTIWYAGKELDFFIEVDSVDEGQDFLDAEKVLGRVACCTHEGGKHQVYIEDPERKKAKKGQKSGSVSAREFFKGVPGRGVDY